MRRIIIFISAFSSLISSAMGATKIRVGYFPNITHAQALIGSQTTREQQGWFERRLGPDVVIQWFPFNAGPSEMEALFADSIDLAYVGPNPALNAYFRSRGEEIRILAGSAQGGAALVVRRDGGIKTAADFAGQVIATPQLGNSQDVAARAWLKRNGFKVTLTGGTVSVLPTRNPEQLQLFIQGKVQGVWTVEPWVSRLEAEAEGVVFVERSDDVATVLVSAVKFLRLHPDMGEKFRVAHEELTEWMNSHAEESRTIVRTSLAIETHRAVSPALVHAAWQRLTFSSRVTPAQFATLVTDAQSVGFLRDSWPLDQLFSGKP